MARFFGKVGYGQTVENPSGSGVWEDVIVEQSYYGDVIRNTKRSDPGESVNDDISVGNSISIVADQYAIDNFFAIRYIFWNGKPWKVSNVDVQRPRLILALGELYNGPLPVGG